MPAIFNSLGSNYRGSQISRFLFRGGSESDVVRLKDVLAKRFSGKAFLFYKGREALTQALLAANLPSGAHVAINGFTCYAVDEAVTRAGLQNTYLDIDPDQLHFTAEMLDQAVKKDPNIKAAIIQNTLGYACDIKAIEKVCKQHDVVLIEDLAHSFGLVYPDGREAGSVGDFTMMSFGRDKGVDAVSGGALIVRSKVAADWEQSLIGHGHDPGTWRQYVDRLYPLHTWLVRFLYKYGVGKIIQVFLRKVGMLPRATDGSFDGFTRLPDTYAREILYLLKEHDRELSHRKHIAEIYSQKLPKEVQLPITHMSKGKSTYLRFPIRVRRRTKLLEKLKAENIHIADIWYDSPIAPPRFMDKTAYDGSCPVSEKTCGELLNLPTHRNISKRQATQLAERITQWL